MNVCLQIIIDNRKTRVLALSAQPVFFCVPGHYFTLFEMHKIVYRTFFVHIPYAIM